MNTQQLKDKTILLIKRGYNKVKPGRKGKVLLGITGGFFALYVGMFATQAQHNPNEVDEKSVPVSAVAMSPTAINPELHLYGKLETPNTVTLKAAVTAYVAAVNIAEGADVEQGQLLVTLDDSDAQLALAQRQADFHDASAALERVKLQQKAELTIFAHQKKLFALTDDKLNRQRKLFDDKLVAKQHLDETEREWSLQAINLEQQQLKIANHAHNLVTAKAKVTRSKAALDQAQLDLDRTQIRSPFTGRVTSLHAAKGDRLAMGMPIIEVFDRDSMQLRVALPAEHSRLFTQQASISATTNSGDKMVHLELIDVAAKIAQGRAGLDGLFRVPANFELAEIGRMLPVQITLPAVENTVAVPVQSLYANKRIYRVDNDRLKGVEVTRVGERINEDGVYEILVSSDELTDNQQIVVTQLPKAVTGLKVEIINGTDDAPTDDDTPVDTIAKN